MKQAFKNMRFSKEIAQLISEANSIVEQMQAAGYTLTLRQLYYQLVAQNIVKNSEKSYKRVGKAISDARLCGLIDWSAIEDRTRNLRAVQTWGSPSDLIKSAAKQFKLDLWEWQSNYVEVWVEKDALLGVLQRACYEYRVPYFACKGYNSQSEMYWASQRFEMATYDSKTPYLLYLGDHDPSGIDMSRDVPNRFAVFNHFNNVKVERLALNIDQVKQYNPPPNFAKEKDSRFGTYMLEYGEDCWELDALAPPVIVDLIESRIKTLVNQKQWDKDLENEEEFKKQLQAVSNNWNKIQKLKFIQKELAK